MKRNKQSWKLLACLLALMMLSGPVAWADAAPTMEELIKSNQELKSVVSDLTQKVSALEGHMAKGIPMPTPSGEGDGLVRAGGGDIRMSGFVDTTFNWDVNGNPAGLAGNNGVARAFDSEARSFDLANAQINFERPAPEKGGAGFKTSFMYGTDARIVDAADTSGGAVAVDEFAIKDAFVDIKIPVGAGLTVWAGKFVTLQGAEVIESYLNWNQSRSLLFNLAIPFTHTGVRATYNWLDGKVVTSAGIVNGWDQLTDINSIKTPEARVTWNVADNFTLSGGGLIGSQTAGDNSSNRGVLDAVAMWTPLPKDLPGLSLMGNYDYGWQENAGLPGGSGPADWQGYAGYARYAFNDKYAISARWEQFWDDTGTRTGVAPLVNRWFEQTYTAEVKWNEDLITRLEWRHDQTDDGQPFDGATRNNQNTVQAAVVYLFA